MGFCKKCSSVIEGYGFCEDCKQKYPKEFHEWEVNYLLNQSYYHKNREKRKEYQRKYNIENKEKQAEYHKKYKPIYREKRGKGKN